MAKYTGADCRLCRREGTKLFLKGEKCYTDKCTIEKRTAPPGQHGLSRKKASSYAVQLREKQKTKRIYGLCEKQFKSYFNKAETMRGVTGENMLILLERRLDNIIFKLGLGSSRAHARQIVNHGLITVNGKCVNIPSYLIKKGDVVAVKENKQDKAVFEQIKKGEKMASSIPSWLSFDYAALQGTILELPKREEIAQDIEEHLIVELYSK